MNRPTLLAATALLALAGCDRLPFFQGEDQANAGVAANASGNATAAAAPNSGIGSSRSLAGLSGNGSSSADAGSNPGGKDPTAIQAGSAGGVDPRLVGRWTDNGDCKTVTELRPDGVFVASNGVSGRWESNGEELIFAREGAEFRLRIDSIEPDRVVTTNAEGQTGPSTRC